MAVAADVAAALMRCIYLAVRVEEPPFKKLPRMNWPSSTCCRWQRAAAALGRPAPPAEEGWVT